tara:strand:- start:2558 stop:3922 length:1365 start_codon:yes stop_codon:yes gene_type:complete
MRKIKINENQLKLIESLILEDKINKVVPNLDKGDIIVITKENANQLKFRVLDNVGNQVRMESVDIGTVNSNNIYFFTPSDLIGNELTVKYIHKQKELSKIGDVRQWNEKKERNIEKIEIYDKLKNPKTTIDIIDPEEEADNKADNKVDDKKEVTPELEELVRELNSMKDGSSYKFTLDDDSELYFTVINSGSKFTNLELVTTKGKGARGYSELVDSDLEFDASTENVELDTSNDSYKFTIKMNRYLNTTNDDGEKNKEPFTINGIVAFDESNVSPEEKEFKNDKDSVEGEVKKLSKSEAMKLALQSPNLRNAFSKKPTFWDLITGKNPQGFFALQNILTKYFNSRSGDIIDGSEPHTFKELYRVNMEVRYELTNKYFVKNNVKLYEGEKYFGKVIKRSLTGVLIKSLKVNKNGPHKINLLSLKNADENIYECEVIMFIGDEKYKEKREVKVYVD